ncbi:hypothetical protein D9615_003325 [Tricholomella constricta]|uniref:F-box domain-containing protein n=1 Tax=Tricholomella constricta TaxID=117010 RepID=A0A8H5HIM8_9AGAR|nr:hypothetical protein D9615_003325 [Tricholomella constricta]
MSAGSEDAGCALLNRSDLYRSLLPTSRHPLLIDIMNSPSGRGILQLPPVDGSPPKSFDLRKYKAAATTLLRSGRTNELKKSNRANPACRLPAEVLQQFFLLCAKSSFHIPTWTWVDITLVCLTWRQAAIDCRELWSYIDFSHPKWTAVTFRRSQLLPISVRATVDPHNQHTIYRTLQHAPMIRDLHLISSIYDIGPLIKTLKSPNRCLESIIINILRPDDNQDIRYSKRCSDTSGHPLPNMKYLELHRTPISLVSPRYTNLRHLSLHHIPFSERPSRHDFLSLLERFTMLEHLTLVRAFPKNIAAGNCNSGRVIHLPNLLTVSLTGSVQELVNILECIVLPPTGRLHCHVDKMGDFKANFWKLSKIIGAHFHNIMWEVPLDTLVITGREEGFRFTDEHVLNPDFCQTLRIRAFGVTEDMEPLLDFVIGPDAHTAQDEVIISALTSVWDAFPLMHIHTLSLQNFDVITQRSWARLLSSLRSLRIVDIGGHPPSGLLWALLLNARSHSHLEHDDMSAMLLPALEDVYLHNVDCFAGGLMVSSSGPVNSHRDLDESRFLEVLFAYLEDRQRCGLALRSLSISRCVNVTLDVLKDLQDCVSHLLWDNRGLYKKGSVTLETERSAVYRSHWPSEPPSLRHYFRLRTLLELD